MKDYSQNGEQSQILRYFDGQSGTVLSIGENDGLTFSNSRALVEAGWNAVLVEPAPIAFGKLRKLYGLEEIPDGHFIRNEKGEPYVSPSPEEAHQITLINAAITPTDGPIDFYDSGTHLNKGDTSLLSTTRPEEIARWKKSGETFTKTTVRGITFDTLLKETGVNRFDFITIDAEGADFSILQQIDLTAVGCRLLCVEVCTKGDREFTEYARKHGMRLLWSCYENRIYCR